MLKSSNLVDLQSIPFRAGYSFGHTHLKSFKNKSFSMLKGFRVNRNYILMYHPFPKLTKR